MIDKPYSFQCGAWNRRSIHTDCVVIRLKNSLVQLFHWTLLWAVHGNHGNWTMFSQLVYTTYQELVSGSAGEHMILIFFFLIIYYLIYPMAVSSLISAANLFPLLETSLVRIHKSNVKKNGLLKHINEIPMRTEILESSALRKKKSSIFDSGPSWTMLMNFCAHFMATIKLFKWWLSRNARARYQHSSETATCRNLHINYIFGGIEIYFFMLQYKSEHAPRKI